MKPARKQNNFQKDLEEFSRSEEMTRKQGRRKIDNWGGGAIFIYSCSAQIISFEIVI